MVAQVIGADSLAQECQAIGSVPFALPPPVVAEGADVLVGAVVDAGTDVLHEAMTVSSVTTASRRTGGVRRSASTTWEATQVAAEIADTWLVGVVAHDDALAGVRVHGGWVAAGPASGRSSRVHVRLRFDGDSSTGFPDPAVSESLLAAEEQLVSALDDCAELVAVMTVPGFRDLLFHTDSPEACVAAMAALDPAQLGYEVEPDVADDPAWSRYRALFADAVPADADRRRVVEAARATGESAPEVLIAHRFRFPTLHEADQAAAALRTSGIAVVFVASDDVDAEAPPVFEAHEVEVLTQGDMARSRDALSAFATSWEGVYEGWLVVPDA